MKNFSTFFHEFNSHYEKKLHENLWNIFLYANSQALIQSWKIYVHKNYLKAREWRKK